MNELYTYPENDFRLYLAHHGVPGQKWGVRNAEWYPIADYQAHLSMVDQTHGSKQLSSKAMRAIENGAKDYKTPAEKILAVTSDYEDISDYRRYLKDPKYKKRLDKIADIGLKAIEKLRGPGYIDEEPYEYKDPRTGKMVNVTREEIRESNREWFIWEDQTIGMPFIADLINKGYTAKQIEKNG